MGFGRGIDLYQADDASQGLFLILQAGRLCVLEVDIDGVHLILGLHWKLPIDAALTPIQAHF